MVYLRFRLYCMSLTFLIINYAGRLIYAEKRIAFFVIKINNHFLRFSQ